MHGLYKMFAITGDQKNSEINHEYIKTSYQTTKVSEQTTNISDNVKDSVSSRNLFSFPAMSNFNGYKFDLDWIARNIRLNTFFFRPKFFTKLLLEGNTFFSTIFAFDKIFLM